MTMNTVTLTTRPQLTPAEEALEARLPVLFMQRTEDRTGAPVYLVTVPHAAKTYQVTPRPQARGDGSSWLIFDDLGEYLCCKPNLLEARRRIAELNPIH